MLDCVDSIGAWVFKFHEVINLVNEIVAYAFLRVGPNIGLNDI